MVQNAALVLVCYSKNIKKNYGAREKERERRRERKVSSPNPPTQPQVEVDTQPAFRPTPWKQKGAKHTCKGELADGKTVCVL